jgi:cytoskeletal protein CcmA (bactofilin family)
MIAPLDDTVEATGSSTQTSIVSLLQPRPASTLPFGVAATPGKSTIGNDLTIIGQSVRIISKGRLQIDGDVFGDITGSDLTVGANGSVTGTVSAERVNVFGHVIGELRAVTAILHPTAHVQADIVHPTLEIAEGAYFEGSVRRCRDVTDLQPDFSMGSQTATSND